MTAPEHKQGERVAVRWPGGFYDFVIEFESIEQDRAKPEWWWIRGLVVSPEGVEHRAWRTFMVRWVSLPADPQRPDDTGGEWQLPPHVG